MKSISIDQSGRPRGFDRPAPTNGIKRLSRRSALKVSDSFSLGICRWSRLRSDCRWRVEAPCSSGPDRCRSSPGRQVAQRDAGPKRAAIEVLRCDLAPRMVGRQGRVGAETCVERSQVRAHRLRNLGSTAAASPSRQALRCHRNLTSDCRRAPPERYVGQHSDRPRLPSACFRSYTCISRALEIAVPSLSVTVSMRVYVPVAGLHVTCWFRLLPGRSAVRPGTGNSMLSTAHQQ